jgi:hypothetical protein
MRPSTPLREVKQTVNAPGFQGQGWVTWLGALKLGFYRALIHH